MGDFLVKIIAAQSGTDFRKLKNPASEDMGSLSVRLSNILHRRGINSYKLIVDYRVVIGVLKRHIFSCSSVSSQLQACSFTALKVILLLQYFPHLNFAVCLLSSQMALSIRDDST